MTITEIRDTLTRLIDAGHGDKVVRDSENPWCYLCSVWINPAMGEVLIEWDGDMHAKSTKGAE